MPADSEGLHQKSWIALVPALALLSEGGLGNTMNFGDRGDRYRVLSGSSGKGAMGFQIEVMSGTNSKLIEVHCPSNPSSRAFSKMLAQGSGLRVQISLHPYVYETLVKSLPLQTLKDLVRYRHHYGDLWTYS